MHVPGRLMVSDASKALLFVSHRSGRAETDPSTASPQAPLDAFRFIYTFRRGMCIMFTFVFQHSYFFKFS